MATDREQVVETPEVEGIVRRMNWRVLRDGKQIATIAGVPMTRDEALESVRFRWPDAEVHDA